jgi:hypothetical protein
VPPGVDTGHHAVGGLTITLRSWPV